MKISDFLGATHSKWPHQNVTVRPVGHYDDLESDGSHDFIVTMIVGNRQVAYRVSLATALAVDSYITSGLREAVKHGAPVNIHNGTPIDEQPEVEVSR